MEPYSEKKNSRYIANEGKTDGFLGCVGMSVSNEVLVTLYTEFMLRSFGATSKRFRVYRNITVLFFSK